MASDINSKKNGTGSALEKALAVLKVIVEQPQSVGVPDLAERLGMSRQSMHRLLHQLDEHGLIIKVPKRDRFAIGERFSKLAIAAMCSANKGIPVLGIIQQVVEEIGESCVLGVIIGREFVYLERAEAEHYPRIYLETGDRMPPYCTSGGKAMLAFLPSSVRSRLLETLTLTQFTQNTITSIKSLKQELEEIRERGFATANQEYADGMVGVGVSVLGPDGAVLAALGMHGPTTRVSLDRAPEIAVKLQTAAKRLAEFWDMSG